MYTGHTHTYYPRNGSGRYIENLEDITIGCCNVPPGYAVIELFIKGPLFFTCKPAKQSSHPALTSYFNDAYDKSCQVYYVRESSDASVQGIHKGDIIVSILGGGPLGDLLTVTSHSDLVSRVEKAHGSPIRFGAMFLPKLPKPIIQLPTPMSPRFAKSIAP